MESNAPNYEESVTFLALIEEEDWLPDEASTQDVIDTIVNALQGGVGEPEFTAVELTSVQMEEPMWSEIERRDDTAYACLQCELTGESFWLPLHAAIPAVAFRYEDEDGNVEDWTEIVHPRLVAAGREEVMRALVEWTRQKVLEASAELEFMLRRLQGLREQEVLKTGWPAAYSEEPLFASGPGGGRGLPRVDSADAGGRKMRREED